MNVACPVEHDVDLLVTEGLLGVLFDDVVAGGLADVGVDAEGLDAERPPDRLPVHACDGDRLIAEMSTDGGTDQPSAQRNGVAAGPSFEGLHPPSG